MVKDTIFHDWSVNSRIKMDLWKFNPSDRTIALTKLLIKHAKLQTKETKIGA